LWLLITLASLVALFLFILSVPLDLAFRADIDGRTRYNLKLVWLFGLVKRELGRRRRKAKPPKAKRKRQGAGIALGVLRTQGLIRQVRTLVADVFKSLSIRQLNADFRIGLGNPADTGLLFAFIGPAFVFINPPSRCRINLEPSFADEAVLEGQSQAVVRLLPIRLLIPGLRFFLSLPVLRAIKKVAWSRWKRRR